MSEASLKPLVYAILFVSSSIAYYFYTNYQEKLSFPVINAYPNDYRRKKAFARYEQGARELIASGFAKFKGPFTLLTPGSPKLILPASLADWVKANKDLDHPELVKDDFMSGLPGFEAQTAIHNADRIVVNTIKAKLSKNEASLPTLSKNVSDALQKLWGDEETWHDIDWYNGTTGVISQAASSIFAGPDLSRNPEWQEITIKYVMDYFTAVVQLQKWPKSLRPLAHYFNPQSRACKLGINRVREMLVAEEAKRESAKKSGVIYNDAIEWTKAAAGDKPIDQGAIQLGLAVAALFTTSEALRQIILDLCKNQDIVPALREEVQQAIAESGWTMNALFKMKLLDSVMKESQRTLPALVGLERKALRDTVLPDGTKIPRGSHIAIDSSPMWSPEIYANPERFDGHRYLKLREATGAPTYVFTASSSDHNTFGMGRFMCPGRFFADTELKLCLAHILLDFDFRLREGSVPNKIISGFYPMVDPFVKLEVRRVHR
ncbi:hypothetical protein VTL71DRAFT_1930 [Oculimacula yallundae]|uniref:Cytochrome P450 n=1 Tax=Oculimacula yallundae TaxID=86028 RepID=A0ABR4CC48_9HELO